MSIFDGDSANLAELWDGNDKIVEVWDGNELVWSALPPLARSNPDHWFSLEDNFHDYNRGSFNTPLTYNSAGRFANRGGHVYINKAEARINTTQPWNGYFTVAAWFENTGESSQTEYLWARGNASTGTAIYVISPSTDKSKIGVRIDDGISLSDWAYTGSNVLPGRGSGWFHFAYTSEVTSDGRNYHQIYVNGIKVQGWIWPLNYKLLTFGPTEWTSIGNVSTDSVYPYEGNLDDIAIWSRTLSAQEVAEIASAGRANPPIIPIIFTDTMPSGKTGQPYSTNFSTNVTGGVWAATGLPPGLTINPSTGVVSGTTTAIGTKSVTITVSGSEGKASKTFSLAILANLVSLSVPFNSNADIDNNFPIRGFDSRTSSSSQYRPAFTFSGMLVAGDNSVDTYWQALHGTEIKSESVQWTMIMGDVMNTVARPTEIILSSDANLQNQLLLQIGSANLNLVSRTTGATTNLRVATRTVGTNSTITVQRSGLSLTVYYNGASVYTYTGTTSDAASWFRQSGRGYSGITMYSTSRQWSSRVADFSVTEY